VFLVIALGWFLQKIKLLNEPFCKTADQYVFRVALPVSLFHSVSTMDIYSDFDLRFCLFCAIGTTIMFGAIWLVSSLVFKDKALIGAFSQASVRSSAAILGLAFATNIYGSAGLVPMMVVASVPLFNIYSVIILSFSPQVGEHGELLEGNSTGAASATKRACINVLTNPIIIGILLGIPFALLRVGMPEILDSAIKSVGGTATPVALLTIGASFSGAEALKKLGPAVVATFIKLLLFPALFLPIAMWLGFRDSAMVAILIMSGAPTTVSCFVMARQMHADSVLTSNAIVLSTLGASVTITLWLTVLRGAALI